MSMSNIAELLIGVKTGDMPTIMRLLVDYERLSREVLGAPGGSRLHRPLHEVAA
jgi:hypothetical protein